MAAENSTGYQQAAAWRTPDYPVKRMQLLYLPLQNFALPETICDQAPDGAIVKAATLIVFHARVERNRARTIASVPPAEPEIGLENQAGKPVKERTCEREKPISNKEFRAEVHCARRPVRKWQDQPA
jgi:hypothetical protein